MNFLITGCAGFIGSHLTDQLLKSGHRVTGIDNFSTGLPAFLSAAKRSSRFRLVRRDLTRPKALDGILTKNTEWVIHLAANADVRHGLQHPYKDLQQNTQATLNVLEAMRKVGVKRIAFSSTGSVYGEPALIPTPETCPFPVQTSLYGTSKAAAEGLIGSYVEGFGFQGLIFRFVSILGERYTHGHVFDFVRQLQKNKNRLKVLGNGKQRKSYLYIGDCIDAMHRRVQTPFIKGTTIFNLGTDEYLTVKDSIRVICDEMGVRPRLIFSGGDRGWPGDNPFIFLDCSKIRRTGWRPRVTIRDAVRATIRYLLANPWLFKERNDA